MATLATGLSDRRAAYRKRIFLMPRKAKRPKVVREVEEDSEEPFDTSLAGAADPSADGARARVPRALYGALFLAALLLLYGTPAGSHVGSFFRAPVSLSSSASASSSSSTPSPSPSARPRIFRLLASTGDTSLPASFFVAPGEPPPRTTHACVGAWNPLYRQGNRSCEFQGLFLDAARSVPWTRLSWAYLAHASGAREAPPRGNASAALAWAAALRAAAHVSLSASNREADQWFLEVAVYEEMEEEGRWGEAGATPPPPLPPPPPLAAASAPFNRTFLLQRSVPANIGHQLWEEYVPWFAALEDLGHSGEQGEYGFLEVEPPEYPGQGFHPATEKCYDALTPRHKPQIAGLWLPTVQAPGALPLVAFPTLAVGLMGRSPGSYPADYAPPAHERGVTWRFRNHYVKSLGLEAEDARDWGARAPLNRSAAPFSFMLLQKPQKRRYQNAEEVRDAIAARWPEARVWVQTWESLNFNHVEEVRLLINTSIFLSMSGTGANTAFLLPRGSVHINTGAPMNFLPGHVGDQFISGNAHVRVLHYQGLAPEDADGPGQDAAVRLPLEKIMPVVEEAVRLWRGGFPTPVPWPENLSPQGKLVACLLHRYPQAQWWASFWQGTRTDAATEINVEPHSWFQRAADNLNADPTALLAKVNIPTAIGYTVPPEFDAVAAHCAKWARTHTVERLDKALVGAANATTPPWLAARAEQHAAARAEWEARHGPEAS